MKKTNHDSAKNPPKKRVRKRNRPKKVKEPKKLSVCETCNLSFVRPSAYKRHMLKHSDLRPFKCDVCDKAFKTNDTLNNHKQIHQEIERACELCGFTTFNKISLALHIRRIHQRDFRYRCDQCEKGFMSNHDLQDHKASHSGKKTFVCETCGNAFWMRSALMTHKRKVHRILQRAPKQFQCNDCTKSFDNKDDLISHVGVHSQTFLCAQCGKKFATIYGLQMHTTSMHMGEKNYQCKVCLKTFARPATLRGHIITHTGQRPYKCDLCEQSFTQRSAMMTHRRKHPGRHPRPPPTFLRDYVNGLVAIKK